MTQKYLNSSHDKEADGMYVVCIDKSYHSLVIASIKTLKFCYKVGLYKFYSENIGLWNCSRFLQIDFTIMQVLYL